MPADEVGNGQNAEERAWLRYGVHDALRREGWTVNRQLTYRLYREDGLAVRRRKRKLTLSPFCKAKLD